MERSELLGLSKTEIDALLPHSDPMIFVDGVSDITGSEITTFKDVLSQEYYFKGHFPDKKIFPGVFIIEFSAQSAILLLQHLGSEIESDTIPLLYHSDFKFKRVVTPDVRLYCSIRLIKKVSHSAFAEAVVKLDGKVVAKGELTFVLKKIDEE
ncbi:3-hydroxyacyl-ACP dehydratase FabZ family protein [Alkalihalobacillus pseudalcaliphilus]|uniref:3-hydroxyacyl-ACP dehydratase FabZ family protein n=1 Tax=Alkalihalobacillus pseudalcaliphilus TaxID=79884 RepID=UPI00064DCD5F|nr:hypothetical protein [Alkalihalobacillus pseudalcaliphilus]KMK76754.1 hypothetical protein AB990_07510 [Alkalihalobacillus pseudalcaliphilus]